MKFNQNKNSTRTILVKDSIRKKKRVLNDALGDDILRYITEILTNADDSYRRLEKLHKKKLSRCPIYILNLLKIPPKRIKARKNIC